MFALAAIALGLRESAAAPNRGRIRWRWLHIGRNPFLGALEIMLDRGREDDWFGSTFIVGVAIVCALALSNNRHRRKQFPLTGVALFVRVHEEAPGIPRQKRKVPAILIWTLKPNLPLLPAILKLRLR